MKLVDQPFSLKHLPYGVVHFPSGPEVATRLHDQAVSLDALRREGLLASLPLTQVHTSGPSLNPLIALTSATHTEIRRTLSNLLSNGAHLEIPDAVLDLAPYPRDDQKVLCPAQPGDYVDFYSSRHHAFRVGSLFRGPQDALPDQYFHLPIGYHGRSSTVQASGRPVMRPSGITSQGAGREPTFGPSERLDYELEVGFLLRGCDRPVSPDSAVDLIFAVVLLNDWSARDIQAYEYRPLGPFLGKSFATSVGAWVTPWEALEGRLESNADSNHPVLPHLRETSPHHLDLPLWADLAAPDGERVELCETNLRHLAWSVAQMMAHLLSNGTIIRAGDLIATGTVSGPHSGSEACLLERTEGGKHALRLGSTSTRTFLQDGDTVTLLGGFPGVGLAPCAATVFPPVTL